MEENQEQEPLRDGTYRWWVILNRILAYVAAVALLAVILLTSVDVAGRTGLNHPLFGAMEISSQLLVVLVALTLAYTDQFGGHIRITFVTGRLSAKAKNIYELVVLAVGFVGFAITVWATGQAAATSWQLKEGELTTSTIPVYPMRAVVVIGFSLLALQFLFRLITTWRRVFQKGGER